MRNWLVSKYLIVKIWHIYMLLLVISDDCRVHNICYSSNKWKPSKLYVAPYCSQTILCIKTLLCCCQGYMFYSILLPSAFAFFHGNPSLWAMAQIPSLQRDLLIPVICSFLLPSLFRMVGSYNFGFPSLMSPLESHACQSRFFNSFSSMDALLLQGVSLSGREIFVSYCHWRGTYRCFILERIISLVWISLFCILCIV